MGSEMCIRDSNRIQLAKENSHCMKCGQKGHWAGDRQCPQYSAPVRHGKAQWRRKSDGTLVETDGNFGDNATIHDLPTPESVIQLIQSAKDRVCPGYKPNAQSVNRSASSSGRWRDVPYEWTPIGYTDEQKRSWKRTSLGVLYETKNRKPCQGCGNHTPGTRLLCSGCLHKVGIGCDPEDCWNDVELLCSDCVVKKKASETYEKEDWRTEGKEAFDAAAKAIVEANTRCERSGIQWQLNKDCLLYTSDAADE